MAVDRMTGSASDGSSILDIAGMSNRVAESDMLRQRMNRGEMFLQSGTERPKAELWSKEDYANRPEAKIWSRRGSVADELYHFDKAARTSMELGLAASVTPVRATASAAKPFKWAWGVLKARGTDTVDFAKRLRPVVSGVKSSFTRSPKTTVKAFQAYRAEKSLHSAEKSYEAAKKAVDMAKADRAGMSAIRVDAGGVATKSAPGARRFMDMTVDRLEKKAASKMADVGVAARKYDNARKALAARTGSAKAPGLRTAEDYERMANREVLGHESSGGFSLVREYVNKHWISSSLTAIGAATVGGVKAYDALTGGPQAESDAEYAKKTGQINSRWDSVTNSVNMAEAFSDASATRKMVSDVLKAAESQAKETGNGEEAYKVARDVIGTLSGSSGWRDALAEAEGTRDDYVKGKVASDLANGVLQDPAVLEERYRAEFDGMDPVGKILMKAR